jgi:hypothetical protein
VAHINLDALNLLPLLGAAEDLLQRMETYQRHAAAGKFRVAPLPVSCRHDCIQARHRVEAELTHLGLELKPSLPLITQWKSDRGRAADGLREWLLEASASGLWDVLRIGATQLPDMAGPLAILREIVRDLRAGAEGKPGQGAKKPKRSTERGEAQTKIIAALTEHHQYDNGSCGNLTPIGVREMERDYEVGRDAASNFFKKQCENHAKYATTCRRNPAKIVTWLKLLNDDYSPHPLFGSTPPERRERGEGSGDE